MLAVIPSVARKLRVCGRFRDRLARASLGILAMTLFATALTAQESTADRLIAHALSNSESYEITAHLADKIGPRLSGSRNAARAVEWTTSKFKEWGIDVRQERVIVPHWVRGTERGRLVSHNNQKIVLTALGGSVATTPEGITADVVEVESYEELDRLGRAGVAGKIVLYNLAMNMALVRQGDPFEAYSKAVIFRGTGATRAAQYGAVAALIRSVGSAVHRTPHTGSLRYDDKVKKIPAAAVTAEDAMLIERLLARGERVRMHLTLTPRTLPDVASANVVAEIRGRENPEEIVLIGGHLDSWDLGTGAIDNASGVSMVMDTMRTLRQLGLQPRRTVRAVLYMNEENGLRGARAYARDHAAELVRHVAAIESDAGATNPLGFRTTLSDAQRDAFLGPLLPALARLDATRFIPSEYVGADTIPLIDAGVPGFGLITDGRHYFAYHHTAADTLDKIDRDELSRATAAFAALTWMIAEGAEAPPRGEPRRTNP